MPLSRKLELVASWNWYRTAPATGFHAKEGVRGKESCAGSSARNRKPCRRAGAAPRTGVAAPAAGASASRLRQTAASVRTRMVPDGCRHARATGCPSNEGRLCVLQRGEEELAGREDDGVRTRTSYQLDRSGQSVLCRPAGESERRPPERVEGKRVPNQLFAQRFVTDSDRGCNAYKGRREEQVESVEQLGATLAVLLASLLRTGRFPVGDGETALDLPGDVLAVELCVLGVELAMDFRDLAHEERVDAWIRPVQDAPSREARRGFAHACGDEGLRALHPCDADGDLLEGLVGRALEARHERPEHARALRDGARHRADVVEARCERKASVGRDEPEGRLEADYSAA